MREIELADKIVSIISERGGTALNRDQIRQLTFQFLARLNMLSNMVSLMKCHFTVKSTGRLCGSDIDLFIKPEGTFLRCSKYPDEHYQIIT